MKKRKVSVIMGSNSDWDTMKLAVDILEDFNIDFETKIISAHRTPERLYTYAKNAKKNNINIIIAGAGGSAHLPGMVSSLTTLPVLAVPIESNFINGLDSLLSIVQMPTGIPTATFAVGKAGAKNAALFAISILAINDNKLLGKLNNWRGALSKNVNLKPGDK
tara:strand:+ start:1255 stop:1743 length:489 start_codon:yes stop_codon:yes gene_type:complete